MPAQFWVSEVTSPGQGAGAASSNISTAVDISPANPQYLTVPPLYVGQKLYLVAYGIYSNTGGPPTLNLGFYYGGVAGTALLTSGVITTTSSSASWPWHMEAWVEVKTLGTSGTVWSKGWLDLPTGLTSIARSSMPATQTQPITVDTTTAKAITAGATHGTAASGNTITCEGFHVIALN